jgi:hypothetical protein
MWLLPTNKRMGLLELFHVAADWVQEFARTSHSPYTDPITRRSSLREGADYGNGHNLPLR